MKLPEQIITERLILRKSSMEDIEFYWACGISPKINKYMSWLAPKDKAEVKQMLEGMNRNWENEIAFNYTILRKSDGQKIGTIEPIPLDCKASIGYVVTPENWGKGYATEAIKSIMEKLFENKNIKRFWTVCDTENPASARVLQKCGLQLEGTLRKWRPSPNISSEPRDCFCYSFIR
jgi:[ribosomal protein S5]-alanine N-acetyltransferase